MRVRVLWGVPALLLAGGVLLFPHRPTSASPGAATDRAVEWYLREKAPDGALPGYDNGYTVGGTADGLFALAAAGENPQRFGHRSGDTPVEYLEAHAAGDTEDNDPRDDAHLAGKIAMAAAMAKEDPHRFGGADLVSFIVDRYDPSTGGYRGGFATSPTNPLGQGLAILGLIAAEEPVPPRALDYLLQSQQPDGGWEFGTGFGSDVSSSSMAMQALAAAGYAFGETPAIQAAKSKAVSYLGGEQNDDGGFSNQKQYAGNFCSGTRLSEVDATGFAIQAIRAGGQDPDGPSWTASGSGNPKRFIESIQHPDGSFSFQEGSDCPGNGGSTYAAVLGLEEASFVCLLDLGTCPPVETSGEVAPAVGPFIEVLPEANEPQRPMVPVKEPEIQLRPKGRAPSLARSGPRPQQAGSPTAAPSVCTEDCPAASPSRDPAPVASIPDVLAGGESERRNALDDEGPVRAAGKGGPNLIVLGGLAVIFALAASIGRQLLRARS